MTMTQVSHRRAAAARCSQPAAAAADPALTVGAIYVGSTNDYGYNRSMHDGLMAMKAAIPGVTVLEAENVPETAEAERVMEGMIQQGAKLIFATSFGHQQAAFDLAKKHPDVVFEHAGGWMQAPNFGNFFGATQAAWYPMGVAAGLMTKSNTLGFVVGVPIGYAIGNVNAFALGARSVNPKAEVRVVVIGSWSDKAKEAAATNALIDQGADVVAMHVDSPATVIQAAEEPRRLLDRLPVGRGARAGAQGLDHRPRLHLGPVHDRDRQERDRRDLQARHGSRGPGRDDCDRAVRRRRAGDDASAQSPPPPTRSPRASTPSPGRSPTIPASCGSRRAKPGAATRWAISTGTSKASSERRNSRGRSLSIPHEYVPVAAAAIGLPLPPDDLGGVIAAFAVLARVAGASDGVRPARGHRRRRGVHAGRRRAS